MDKKSYANAGKFSPHLAAPPPPPSPIVPLALALIVKALTREEVKTGIETFTKEFQASHRFESLTTFFEQGQKTNITKYICLGLGNFMSIQKISKRKRESNGSFNTPIHHLAMLEMLLTGLAKGEEIQVYFQDPVLTKPEKDYLHSCGYIVLQDGSTYKRMSASTFLFAPRQTEAFISRALVDVFPALYIGIDMDEAVEDIRMDALKGPFAKAKYIRPLKEFKRVSFETPRLPIFADGVTNGLETWRNASVHWLLPNHGGKFLKNGLGNEDGKTENQSTLESSAGEKKEKKGKGIVMDWRSQDDPKEGRGEEGGKTGVRGTVAFDVVEMEKVGGLAGKDGESKSVDQSALPSGAGEEGEGKGKETVTDWWTKKDARKGQEKRTP